MSPFQQKVIEIRNAVQGASAGIAAAERETHRALNTHNSQLGSDVNGKHEELRDLLKLAHQQAEMLKATEQMINRKMKAIEAENLPADQRD